MEYTIKIKNLDSNLIYNELAIESMINYYNTVLWVTGIVATIEVIRYFIGLGCLTNDDLRNIPPEILCRCWEFNKDGTVHIMYIFKDNGTTSLTFRWED